MYHQTVTKNFVPRNLDDWSGAMIVTKELLGPDFDEEYGVFSIMAHLIPFEKELKNVEKFLVSIDDINEFPIMFSFALKSLFPSSEIYFTPSKEFPSFRFSDKEKAEEILELFAHEHLAGLFCGTHPLIPLREIPGCPRSEGLVLTVEGYEFLENLVENFEALGVGEVYWVVERPEEEGLLELTWERLGITEDEIPLRDELLEISENLRQLAGELG